MDWGRGNRQLATMKEIGMAQRVTLDAMIPRADFGQQGQELTQQLFKDFPLSYLEDGSPILQLLRKPDFQRERERDKSLVARSDCDLRRKFFG